MKPNPIDPDALGHLRRVFKGSLIDPRDPRYESSRRVWNAMIDRYPALIAQCTDAADVASATASPGKRTFWWQFAAAPTT